MIQRPLPQSLDWHASVSSGWDPESGIDPPFSFGSLSKDIYDYENIFEKLVDDISKSEKSYLLNPITDVSEPEIFPEVRNPIAEEVVAVDPTQANSTRIFPKAALWQSGWENAKPYIVVREQVLERLKHAAEILNEFNPELSLCITDGWRSIEQQRDLYNSFYPNGWQEGEPVYVSIPHDSDLHAAPHPSGGAVDVLLGIGNQAIRIGSDLDYMDKEANTDHFEDPKYKDSLVQNMRRIFVNTMIESGFICIDSEWWHFEYGTRRWAGKIGTEPLYGNAKFGPSVYENIRPVDPIELSRRSEIVSK